MTYLTPGDIVPFVTARSTVNPKFALHTVAGRRLVLFFLGSLENEASIHALRSLLPLRDQLLERQAQILIVNATAQDEVSGELKKLAGDIPILWDHDLSIHIAYGMLEETQESDNPFFKFGSFILDQNLRLRTYLPINEDQSHKYGREVIKCLAQISHFGDGVLIERQAPVLIIPNVLELDFCRELINLYKAHGAVESGYMTDIDGKTIGVIDHNHKNRQDYIIEDENIRERLKRAINRRVIPEVKKVFKTTVTRMERYIIACYDAENRGHFNAHRDNTTRGTAHRKFALTLNLNTESYEGGNLRFPEYSNDQYRPPTGGVAVFSCDILHEATLVTRGSRFCFLPFLYDEDGASLRDHNLQFVEQGLTRQSESYSEA